MPSLIRGHRPLQPSYSRASPRLRNGLPQLDGSERLAARVEDGKVTMVSVDAASPFSVFQPVRWWESSKLLYPLIAAAIFVLVLTSLAWPIAAYSKSHYGIPARLGERDARVYRWLRLGAIGILLTCVAWIAVISLLSGNLFAFDDDLDPWLVVLRIGTLVFTIGTGILACWNARLAWQHGRGLASGAWAIALCFACFLMLYVSIAFNLVGFALDY